MKKGIAVLILAAAVLSVCFTEYFYLQNSLGKMERDARAIRAELEIDKEHIDTDKLIEMTENLEKYWLTKKPCASVMLNHVLLMEYTAIIGRLKTNVKINEYPMAAVEADNLLRQTDELKGLHAPSFKSIF